jgi:hypothetical protein
MKMEKFDAVWFGKEIRDVAQRCIPTIECECHIRDVISLGVRENSVMMGRNMSGIFEPVLKHYGAEDGLADLLAFAMVHACIQTSAYWISGMIPKHED